MKRVNYYISFLLFGALTLCLTAEAQSPADAYRNVLRGSHGTARAQGLGGAVGAMGVDATAVYVNPAGSALAYRHYVSFTMDVGGSSTVTRWGNNMDPAISIKRSYPTRQFNNISFFSPAWYDEVGASKRFIKVNWGIAWNKDFDFKRDYEMGTGPLQYGLTDFMALRGTVLGRPYKEYKNDPFLHPVDPLVAMGVKGEFIEAYPTVPGEKVDDAHHFRTNLSAFPADKTINDPYKLFAPASSRLNVSERGGKNSFDINTSVGVDDRFFFGATLRLGSMGHQRYSMYREDVDEEATDPTNKISKHNKSWIEYGNSLTTTGWSMGLNLGAIVSLGDYVRVGASYLLPQVAWMRETYQATSLMQNDDFKSGEQRISFDSGVYENRYRMTTPGELTLSATALFGRFGLINYDFAYRNLGHSRFAIGGSTKSLTVNQYIAEDYGWELTHRVGVEVNPLSWLSIRAGYSYTGNPIKQEALRNDPIINFKEKQYGLTYDATTSGTIPDFLLPRTYHTYSAGVGFNIKGSCMLDLSYVHTKRREKVYPFPGLSTKEGTLAVVGGDMKTAHHTLVATLVVVL